MDEYSEALELGEDAWIGFQLNVHIKTLLSVSPLRGRVTPHESTREWKLKPVNGKNKPVSGNSNP